MQVIKLPIDRVLLIDDDEDDCLVFKLALAEINTGIKFHYRNNCEQITDTLEELQPDLVFLDINLPKVNGIECLELMKNSITKNRIPVVMYSSSELPKDLANSFEMGATLYLRKPNNITQLIESLQSILQMAWHSPDAIKKQYLKNGQYHVYS